MFMVKPVPPLPSHSSVQDLTERFSAYFTDKIANLRRDLPNCPVPSPAASIIQPCNCSLAKFSEITPKVVRETIDKSPSKSCLSYPIPTRTLKSCLDDLLPVVTSLVNSSLRAGIFPNAFKEGRLLPKIKKVSLDKEDLNNYRQITNFAFVSKVTEIIVARQIHHYLVSNNLYPKLQAAYQQSHSTETALLRVHNDIPRAVDNKNEVILVLLDLSAAFDTIDHDILINRLRTQFGFSATALQWLESYIRDRSQKVVIGCTESRSQPPLSGVPQDSVLGPLLFILYFAPLENVVKSHGLYCMMYADDSQLYIIVIPDSRHSALDKLDQCISDIQSFFLAKKFRRNPTKTEIVHFHSRFTSHVVSVSKEARNLGVVFDNHLTMSNHINSICRSSSQALRNIGRVRKYLDQANTERLVHAFITSRLDYCNSLLYGLPTKEISKLQRLQSSAARLVMKCKPRDHISPLLQKINWFPVKHRIIFKNVHGTMPQDLLTRFEVLKKCRNKFDCLVYEMLFIRTLKPNLNVQSESIRAKVFL